jgi:hypothetical protein
MAENANRGLKSSSGELKWRAQVETSSGELKWRAGEEGSSFVSLFVWVQVTCLYSDSDLAKFDCT